MRVPIVRGRGFARSDFGNAPGVALVTREAVRRYWPDEDPIGRRIAFEGDEKNWLEIVGVAGDVRNSNAGSGPTPQVYVPSSWRPERATAFVIRSAGGDPAQLAPSIRNEIAQLDKNQPAFDIRSMQRCWSTISGALISLPACSASSRLSRCCSRQPACTDSCRIRSASARARSGCAWLLAPAQARFSEWSWRGELCRWRSVCALGSLGAASLARMTSAALSEVDLRDPLAYVVVAVPLVVVALVATYIPARRATRVDPLLALRAE
jgi:hypothetical protein